MSVSIGSLCSGYGGLELGVQAVVGGRIAWHAENDADASRVLAHRYPAVPNLGDLTAVDWTTAEPVDIVTAGFPCQDLSYAGRGTGIQEGNRSGLWYVIADALAVLRPRLVVLENVRAIVSRRPGLDVVLADLARLGFDAEWTCLRASDVGAPHPRNRWFLIASSRGCWSASSEDADQQPRDERRIAASLTAHGWRPRPDAGRRGGAPAAHANGLGLDRPAGQHGPYGWPESAGGGVPNQRGSSGDLMLPSAVAQLLPTPRARDGKRGGKDCLEPALLPTPTVADSIGGHINRGGARKNELYLCGLVKTLGDSTDLPSPDGSTSPGGQLPLPLNWPPEADNA